MPETPIALRVPDECPNCHRSIGVVLQTNVHGIRVVLCWVCGACEHEWPVVDRETTPARARKR